MLGEKSVNAIGEGVMSNLYDSLDTLSQEHDKAMEIDEKFAIDIKVVLGPHPNGTQMDIKSKFSVINTARRIVNEEQMSFLSDQRGEVE